MKEIFFYLGCGLIGLQQCGFAADIDNKENHNPNSQVMTLSDKLTIKEKPITALKKEITIPEGVTVSNLFDQVPGFQSSLGIVKENHHARINPFQPFTYEKSLSAFFYSGTGNIYCGLVPDIQELMFFSEFIKKLPDQVDEDVTNFVTVFDTLMRESSRSISNLSESAKYIDEGKTKGASLEHLLDVYQKHKVLFRDIKSKALEGEENYQKNKDKNAWKRQFLENYGRLITQGVFVKIIKDEYVKMLNAHKALFDLTCEWHLICQSYIATAILGSVDNIDLGKKYFNGVLLPIFNELMLNKGGRYHNITIFSYGDVITKMVNNSEISYGTRGEAIKFQTLDGQVFVIILSGTNVDPEVKKVVDDKSPPKVISQAESKPTSKPKKQESSGCIIC